ncbi:hypothetical protein CMI37_03520 [Candidatus Pacearchaeota archaeon]|nr:hypothetical protein [Candidatus Pacearchaeota archaeon]|tara:strand:+ start:1473 stop:1664 length:192 start_codon:yes stop_codon:yes gene_type:complete
MKSIDELTEDDFRLYEEVRQLGQYNMYGPTARLRTGLDRDTYIAVLTHYEELMVKYPGVRGRA